MKQRIRSGWLAALCLCAAIACAPATQAAQMAIAQPVYTELGGGGGSTMRNPNHFDFALQFNKTLDNGDGVKDGGGIWIGFRHSLMDIFSLGGKFGAHSYSIDNAGFKDTVSAVPLLFTAQLERNFNHNFNLFAQLGMGPSFNNIKGDATDLFNLKLDTSFAFDVDFGGTVEFNQNIAVGINFDWFISAAHVHANSALIDDSINLSHFGIGILFTASF